MKILVSLALFILLFTSSYSQKVSRWRINDSTYGEIIEDSVAAALKPNSENIRVKFLALGDFYNDSLTIIVRKTVLLDTTLTTLVKDSNGEFHLINEDRDVFVSNIQFPRSNVNNIIFLFNRRRIVFPFKKGFTILYFSFYSERYGLSKLRRVYSLTYTNKFLETL